MDSWEKERHSMAAQGSGASIGALGRPPTIKERCEMAVKQAEERLTQVKRAREILNQHPELEELLDIMQRSHF